MSSFRPLQRRARRRLLLALLSLLLVGAGGARAGEVTVAVAANFAHSFDEIARHFTRQTGHGIKKVVGATGLLYAQIERGAPFDVFLAADSTRPSALVAAGLADEETRFTYAFGQLALWQPGLDSPPDLMNCNPDIAGTMRLAMANPRLAPYGVAAQTVLNRSGLTVRCHPVIVFGPNVGATYAMVASGNVTAGFVSLSQLLANGISPAEYWRVDPAWYEPIAQDAVLVRRNVVSVEGADSMNSDVARSFLQFLQSDLARMLIERAGYFTTRPEANAPNLNMQSHQTALYSFPDANSEGINGD